LGKDETGKEVKIVASIRGYYESLGVDRYYAIHGSEYRNPHEQQVRTLLQQAEEEGLIGNKVLDLCCGSGEVTCALPGHDITGVDPYTSEAYRKRTGKECLPLSFLDIAQGRLQGQWDTIVCSFALHLCPESLLPQVLWQLRQVATTLVVITPHKRPDCDGKMGWVLVEERKIEKVTMKVYI